MDSQTIADSHTDRRAISYVVGTVFTLGIILTASFAVVGLGVVELNDETGQIEQQAAEQDFKEIAQTIETEQDAIQGGIPQELPLRITDLSTGAQYTQQTDAVTIRLKAGGFFSTTTIFETKLNTIRFQSPNTDRTFVYENGAVFTTAEDGTVGTVVEPARIITTGDATSRLSLSVVDPTLTQPIQSEGSYEIVNSQQTVIPIQRQTAANLIVEIETNYPNQWETFLTRSSGVNSPIYTSSVDEDAGTVEIGVRGDIPGAAVPDSAKTKLYQVQRNNVTIRP